MDKEDFNSLSALLDEHGGRIYRLALMLTKNSADAQDVFQEVFLRLVKRGGGFESRAHAKAWLIRVTVNCGKKQLRSAWRRHTVPLSEELRFESPEKSEVYFAVAALPAKYRTVVHLHYYEGYSVGEIARLTGSREGTVKSQLFRARALLRDRLMGGFDHV